ncbi:MAG: zf-TFIIB domain-containing protein [Lentisphaerae bacterium]|nr:zf-TFIIB domain-containing protein [Lentisphaerota bacterium]MCP4100957.1 zf-TFIIB domain-containing protein [Lentisphaerota bacterium]
MICPKCREESMQTVEYENSKVQIDRCDICDGVWLDGNEMDQILGKYSPQYVSTLYGDASKRLCPHCRKNMFIIKYPDTYAEVEMCCSCKGIWLDAFEMEEICMVRKHKY